VREGYGPGAWHGPDFGAVPEPFPLTGEDWFTVDGPATLEWEDIVRVLESEQRKLEAAARKGSLESADTSAFDVVLGVTCHAVYHAGQIQLIKLMVRK
jgi:hypothetical protein